MAQNNDQNRGVYVHWGLGSKRITFLIKISRGGQSSFHHAEVFLRLNMHQLYFWPRTPLESLRRSTTPSNRLGGRYPFPIPHFIHYSRPATPRPLRPLENFLRLPLSTDAVIRHSGGCSTRLSLAWDSFDVEGVWCA